MKRPVVDEVFTYDYTTGTIKRIDAKPIEKIWQLGRFGNKQKYECIKYKHWYYPITTITKKLTRIPDWS